MPLLTKVIFVIGDNGLCVQSLVEEMMSHLYALGIESRFVRRSPSRGRDSTSDPRRTQPDVPEVMDLIANDLRASKTLLHPLLGSVPVVFVDSSWFLSLSSLKAFGGDLRSGLIRLHQECWADAEVFATIYATCPPPDCSRPLQRVIEEYGPSPMHFSVADPQALRSCLQSMISGLVSDLIPPRPSSVGKTTAVQQVLAFDDLARNDGHKILLHRRLAPAIPTAVYDTYWRFAAERQEIFLRRLRRDPPPWTSDAILQRHKFTNAYRASDRVSQYLIRKVIYEGSQASDEVFFRIILFKLFNRIETWETLQRCVGVISYQDYSFERYSRVLSDAMERGQRIYSAAYIMPTGSRSIRSRYKHECHLHLLEMMMVDDVPLRIMNACSMRGAFEILRQYPMLGDFLAYQYVTDVNYSSLTDFSEMEFTVPGPGARDGISKCFTDLGGLSEIEIIRWVAEHQEEEFSRLGIDFQSLWGRPLQLIDCQNLFCEVSKYARLAHPDVRGISDRTRIKQAFRPTPEPVNYWYPPKWGINEKVRAYSSGVLGQRPVNG